jgi:hypothetical protein
MLVLAISLLGVYCSLGKRSRNKVCKGLVSILALPFKLLK